ncbi:MAG TPA: hypothetical protein PLN48_00625 [Lachnospiraceae bacterium]|jgi:hypothetical protein|nr:hypothetical protein [Lachnospiraceae bacterium]
MFRQFDVQMWEIFAGNGLLLVCSLFYLLWWTLVFKPGASGSAAGTASITLAVLTGIVGLGLMLAGLNAHVKDFRSFSNWYVILAGIILYAVLLLITRFAFDRQVTSELLIFTGWTVLEISVVNEMYGIGRFGTGLSIFLAAVIVLILIISLICYVLYYRLDAYKGWIDGMIPLISVAAGMVVILISLALGNLKQ